LNYLREWYLIGVYDPSHYDEWPYYFYDEGAYISNKGRIASANSAREFDNIEEAEKYLEQWGYKKKDQFKYEFVRLERGTKPQKPLYGPEHPLAKLIEAKKTSLFLMASDWYHGRDPNQNYEKLGYSKSTFYRHRKELLQYGVDIKKEPEVVFLTPTPKEPRVIEVKFLTENDLPEDLRNSIWKPQTPTLRLVTSDENETSKE